MALNEQDETLAVKAAELYYEADKTQDEIGAALGVSRWKVGRLLSAARAHGFVRIEIIHPSARRLALERELCGFYDLDDAIVVPTPESDQSVTMRVAEAAADYLTALRPVPRTLGVSWGRTLHAVAGQLRPGWAVGVNTVQINGSVSSTRQATAAADTAAVIAHKAGGSATLLPSPAIFEYVATRRAVEADRAVQSVLEIARGANAYLFGAGIVDASSVHVDSGYLSREDVDTLAAHGAVGDVLGRFITSGGVIADPELDSRTLGMSLDDLRRARVSIAVIAGEAKHRIAHAVVANGLCTVLITDESTAHDLLGHASLPQQSPWKE